MMVLKRFFDLIGSFLGLIIFSLFGLGISLLIKIKMPGPVFFKQKRVGQHGNLFTMVKFRTMTVNHGGNTISVKGESRITQLGETLRKYKLDELPGLWNVLKGEMSFVGPRPQVEKYTCLYNDEEKIIFSVKPGITDYASIKFINLDQILGDEFVDEKYFKEIEPIKNNLRVKYAKESSLFIDIKIIFMTCIQLLRIKKLWNIED